MRYRGRNENEIVKRENGEKESLVKKLLEQNKFNITNSAQNAQFKY